MIRHPRHITSFPATWLERRGWATPIAEWSALRRSGHRFASYAVLLAVCVLSAACYSYVPLDTSPEPGTEVRLELNDRGRAALADSIGPQVRSITGTLQTASVGVYDMEIRSVEYFSGMVQKWSGERLAVPADFVVQSSERRLDRRRSWIAGAGSAAALVVAILGVDLIGSGSPPRTPVGEPPVDR